MEGKKGRGRPRQKLLDWMDTANLRKKLNIKKRGAIEGLDLPESRELEEEEDSACTHKFTANSVHNLHTFVYFLIQTLASL